MKRIIAHHLVLSGYGTWLANDPRGSGSVEVRKEDLKELGGAHFGRKPNRDQPSRAVLRSFYREAEPLLDFKTLWFREQERAVIAKSISRVIQDRGYTVWACAVLRNHTHILPRIHRDDANVMWDAFAEAARDALRLLSGIDERHPVWSTRPYKVFLYTPNDVEGRIDYIRKNPMKEGLPEQHWDFVTPYEGWPFHKKNFSNRPKRK